MAASLHFSYISLALYWFSLVNNLLRFTLSLFFVLVIALPTVSIAQTSVDASLRGCIQQPECAATMRGLGLTGSAMTSPGSSVIVPFARAGAPAAARIVSPVIQAAPVPGGAAAVATAIAAYVWPWGTPQAEDFAASPIKLPDAINHRGYGGARITYTSVDYQGGGATQRSANVLEQRLVTRTFSSFKVLEVITCSGTGYTDQGFITGFSITTASGVCYPGTEPAPVYLPNPQHIPDTLPAPTPLYYPVFDPDPGVQGDERYMPATVPGSDTEPSIFVIPGGHPQFGFADPSTEWRENPLLINPRYNPDGSPADNPDPTENPAPGASPDLNGQYEDDPAIAPSTFGKDHFIPHLLTTFTGKFPLDILGTLPAQGLNACPVFTFWGESYELCPISTLMAAIKAPTLLAFIIWAVLAL